VEKKFALKLFNSILVHVLTSQQAGFQKVFSTPSAQGEGVLPEKFTCCNLSGGFHAPTPPLKEKKKKKGKKTTKPANNNKRSNIFKRFQIRTSSKQKNIQKCIREISKLYLT